MTRECDAVTATDTRSARTRQTFASIIDQSGPKNSRTLQKSSGDSTLARRQRIWNLPAGAKHAPRSIPRMAGRRNTSDLETSERSAWYTVFWGHTFTDWTQIEPPYRNGEGAIQALKLDWNRFQSESLLNCFQGRGSGSARNNPRRFPSRRTSWGHFSRSITTTGRKELDIVSWDSYPPQGSPPETCRVHPRTDARPQSEGQPFLLMEQSPSQQNWQPYNTVKMPSELRLQSFQAMAHGADSVMYFPVAARTRRDREAARRRFWSTRAERIRASFSEVSAARRRAENNSARKRWADGFPRKLRCCFRGRTGGDSRRRAARRAIWTTSKSAEAGSRLSGPSAYRWRFSPQTPTSQRLSI